MFWHVQIENCLENVKKSIEELKLDAAANKNINTNAALITTFIKQLIGDIHGGQIENLDLNTDITAILQQYRPNTKQYFLQRLKSFQKHKTELFSAETDAVKEVLKVEFAPIDKALADVEQALTANLPQAQIITAKSSPVAIFPTLDILATALLSEVKQNKLQVLPVNIHPADEKRPELPQPTSLQPVVLPPIGDTSTARTINQLGAEASPKFPDLTNLKPAKKPFIPSGALPLLEPDTSVADDSSMMSSANVGAIRQEIRRPNLPPTPINSDLPRYMRDLEAKRNTPQGAIDHFKALGCSPYLYPRCNNRAELQQFMQAVYACDELTFDRIFKYTQDADFKWKCEVRWQDISFSAQSDKIDEINRSANPTGKNDVTQQVGALLYKKLREHEQLCANLLINIPPHTDGNPTSTLLQFLQTHSIYKNGDELQGIYRSYMRSVNGSTEPLFECRLIFKGTELAQGRGDTKRRAREEASRNVFKSLTHLTTNFLSKPGNKDRIDELLEFLRVTSANAGNDQREQAPRP